MASQATVRALVEVDEASARAAIHAALSVFPAVDTACTRFDPGSPLMRANARPHHWHEVPEVLYQAVLEAHRAYMRTHGRFDPRVLQDLVTLGYDRSLPFADGQVEAGGRVLGRRSLGRRSLGRRSLGRRSLGRWRPRFRGGPSPRLHLGGVPIDLGGIGKGLAVRWAAERLAGKLDAYLVDAGGDCCCRGRGPDGDGWRVGVEDPIDPRRILAVLELRNTACATSSIRLRRWRSGGQTVHHLIDPHHGRPGGRGLLAVTVVAGDPADAEVLSKTLFLRGRDGILAEARRRNVSALWVDVDGLVTESPRLAPHVIWRAS